MSLDPILEKASEALLRLAGERAWPDISLRDIALEAGVDLADLYARAPAKAVLLGLMSLDFDRAALATAGTASEDVHDRLFDATMARIEVMEPCREPLIAIARSANFLVLAPHLPFTARAILEAAGVEATPPRVAAMSLVWGRSVQVWRDDEGALNRTMAEIDRRLRQLRDRLRLVGAGF
ncbi:MAG TPA: TetR family transcriptional regulator [Caulobacteraceae bacterium]|nr:TetR family transcriptional regulator [Caulobacteraceae bacterium]